MNFVFISPNFPHTYWNFCDRLKRNGVNVLGIGDCPYDDLEPALKDALTEYYKVGNMENYDEMYRAVEASVPSLPEDKPRYVMGLGVPHQLAECVARGVDMFDCVIPTRVARHGTAMTKVGNVAIKAAKWAFDQGPVEEGCGCYCCRNFTRSYIRHLLNCGEMLGLRLLTIHNLHFLNGFMREMRAAIADGTFAEWKNGISPASGGMSPDADAIETDKERNE